MGTKDDWKTGMTKLPFVITLLALTACTSPSHVVFSPDAEFPRALQAFRDVCLNTAPTFAAAEQAAVGYGVNSLEDLGIARVGVTTDRSMSVQVKAGKECVITTESQPDRTLTNRFAQLVAQRTGATGLRAMPFKATFNGVRYVFQHDRKGGETYVMLRFD